MAPHKTKISLATCFIVVLAKISCNNASIEHNLIAMNTMLERLAHEMKKFTIDLSKNTQENHNQQLRSCIDIYKKNLLTEMKNLSDIKESKLYCTKMSINNNTKIIVQGDMHGDAKAFDELIKLLTQNDCINNDLTLKKNTYLVFLGDLVVSTLESGPNIPLLIFKIISLKNKNPNQVLLLKGNHEYRISNQEANYKDNPTENSYIQELRI